jgi:tRNA A37 threonylcarbamoyladenosine dehydratase
MNTPTFLSRAVPLLKAEGIKKLSEPLIAYAGLGGVGGLGFLSLVRAGIGKFRIADNGIFNIEDLNRQAAAFETTVGKPKVEVYRELARQINPNIEVEPYNEGITEDNVDEFLSGASIHVAASDCDDAIKFATAKSLRKYKIPMFGAAALGFGTLMTNFHPSLMSPEDFFSMVEAKSDPNEALPSYIYKHFPKIVSKSILKSIPKKFNPSISIGPALSGLMIASEVLAYILRDTLPLERKIVFAPRFIILDFLTLKLSIMDITKD